MVSRLDGRVALVFGAGSSGAGLSNGRAAALAYDMAAKAAVNQLTVAMALTHARDGIRVNAILPGLIDTPLAHQLHADTAKRHAASPTGRMGSPWDVAHAAVFLASEDAAYVNGVCPPVDGGLSARA